MHVKSFDRDDHSEVLFTSPDPLSFESSTTFQKGTLLTFSWKCVLLRPSMGSDQCGIGTKVDHSVHVFQDFS